MESRLVRSKSNLQQMLKDMLVEEHKKNYLAAEDLKNQANKLKAEIQDLEKKGNKKKQTNQVEEVLLMQKQQLKNWRNAWDVEIKQFTLKFDQMQKEQKEKHEEELIQIQKNFDAEVKEYHDSGAIIELKRKQDIFSRQTKYLEAHYIQTQRNRLEIQQRETFQKLRIARLNIQIKKTKFKQQAESQVLRKKRQAKLSQYNQAISSEEKILLQKHKNVLRELNGEQEKQNLIQSGAIKNTLTLTKSFSPSSTYQRARSPSTFSRARSPSRNMFMQRNSQLILNTL